jgi:F-type H+-transporting ATPase subunit b
MQDMIQQLEALFISALPTTALFVVLVVAYQLLIQGPLTAVLKQRHAKTTGAVEEARKSIAEAEKRTESYSEQLRHSRAEIYRAREERLQKLAAEREVTLEAAREEATVQVNQARTVIERETAVARKQVEESVHDLAQQVLKAVLPAATGGSR